MPRRRSIFFGTPEFSVACLQVLCDLTDVALVVTQPDRASGRGMQLTAPPVKVFAQSRGIEVAQPKAIRTPEFAERLRRLDADVGLVVAYGRILPLPVLRAPRLGCVNIHASLLPKLRGAAPIQRAIMLGERTTGVCLMQMDEGMDTGPVLGCASTEIGADETAGELFGRLSVLGATLLRDELLPLLRGELVPKPQDHSQATLAPMLTKDEGRIAWVRPATEIERLVRGMLPSPGAFSFVQGQRVKIHRTRVLTADGHAGEPGMVVRADRHGIEIACGEGVLVIEELQPDGKRRMLAEQFLAGNRVQQGTCFTSDAA
jgi:methionyl-tRNA formyltransferase